MRSCRSLLPTFLLLHGLVEGLLGFETLEEGDDGVSDLWEVSFEVLGRRVVGEASFEAVSELSWDAEEFAEKDERKRRIRDGSA